MHLVIEGCFEGVPERRCPCRRVGDGVVGSADRLGHLCPRHGDRAYLWDSRLE